MKKTKKRGFTIVELVIVIAVIAILAAVLVPTFTNVISAAKESAALQEAKANWDDYMAAYVTHYGNVPPADARIYKYTTKDNVSYYFDVKGASFVGKSDKTSDDIYAFKAGETWKALTETTAPAPNNVAWTPAA